MAAKSDKLISVLLVLAIAAIVFVLLLPAVPSSREAARLEMCERQLRAIGQALNAYHPTHGSLPPAFIADENGRPMHSWRVLLLPFLGEQALYDKYRFDEPWDGPHNSALHDGLKGNNFFCRSSHQSIEHTNYVAVIGPETAMPGARARTLDDLRSSGTNPIVIVEIRDSGIHWMEPRDLDFDEMSFGINEPSRKGISSEHSGFRGAWSWKKVERLAHVLLADGTVRDLPESTPPRVVHELLVVKEKGATGP